MRTLSYTLYLCFATALLLEIVLQAGACVATLTSAEPLAGATPGGILCVGDSFTYGSGASGPQNSYPMVLQRVLRQRLGVDLPVTNVGLPGQNSRDVLLHLAAQLERTRPAILSVMIGANDRWSRPESLAREELARAPGGRFALRWRTGRLISMLFGAPGQRSAAKGRPEERRPTDAMAETADRLLREAGLAPGSLAAHRPAAGPPELEELLVESRRLLRRGDPIEARRKLLAGIDDFPRHPGLRSLLAEAYTRVGDRDAAVAEAARLRAAYAASPSADGAAALLEALLSVGLWKDADEVSRRASASFPNLAEAWRVRGRVTWVYDQQTAAAAYQRLVELSPHREARILGRIAKVLAPAEPDRAVRILAASALFAPGLSLLGAQLPAMGRAIPMEKLDALIELEQLDERGRDTLTRLRAEMYTPRQSDEYLDVLRQHLGAIQDLARERGVRTLLLSYPASREPLREMYRAAAREGRSVYVPVAERFEQELLSRQREELFVVDGHCNDAGYALVAETLADTVAGLGDGSP